MKKILLCLFLFAFIGISVASDWYSIGETYFIDRETINIDKKEKVVDYWVKATVENFEIKNIGNRKISYALVHTYIDCKTRKVKVKEMWVYDKNDRVIESDYGENSQYNSIVPDTRQDMEYKIFCKIK